MEKYNITEDQIKYLAKGKAKKKIYQMFPEVFKAEIEDKLLQKCIVKYGRNWQTTKVKHSGINKGKKINKGSYTSSFSITEIWSKNGLLYKNGIWAKPLKKTELTIQELLDIASEKLNIKVENLKIKKLPTCNITNKQSFR